MFRRVRAASVHAWIQPPPGTSHTPHRDQAGPPREQTGKLPPMLVQWNLSVGFSNSVLS